MRLGACCDDGSSQLAGVPLALVGADWNEVAITDLRIRAQNGWPAAETLPIRPQVESAPRCAS